MKTMKTAFSLPNPLFKSGERLRKKLRLSRSQAYRQALAEWILRRGEDPIVKKLNAIYGPGGEESALDPAWEQLQAEALKDR